MEWLAEVETRLKRNDQILFSKNNELIQRLDFFVHQYSHRTLVLWALELAEESVCLLEQKYPNEYRPRSAIDATRLWSEGKVKMSIAKQEILKCHAMAKELTNLEDIALCHAIGQACGVVHTPGHALGYPIYELTALVRKYGVKQCRSAVEFRCDEYIEKLDFCEKDPQQLQRDWATFLKS